MFYKMINGNELIGVSTVECRCSVEVNESEYSAHKNILQNVPTDPNGYTYKLRADTLEWELVELPPIEPEPLTDEEALTRYANELTGQNDTDLISAAETLIEQRIKENGE